jgi:hypothetical protein
MNKNPVNQCSSPNCSIYQYRSAAKGNIGVSFFPILTSKARIDDNSDDCNTKTMSTYGSKNEGCKSANSDDLRRVV